LSRPDIIPPQPPVFTYYKADTKGIYLKWQKSNSPDVAKYILYRRDEGDKQWHLIAQVVEPDTTTSFYDQPSNNIKSYEYTIIAVDSSKLESVPAKSLKLKLLNYGIRPQITKIYGVANPDIKTAEITWNYNEEPVVNFVIYKAETNKPMSTYRSVKGNEKKFDDKNIEKNKTYFYRIKAVFADGSESALSPEVVVEF
jgi:hypothetical protein